MQARESLHSLGFALAALTMLAAPGTAQTSTVAASWRASPAAQLKTVLRSVAAAQARHFGERGRYAASAEALRPPQDNATRVEILAARRTGWQARAMHRDRPGRSCVIFVGRVEGLEAPRTDLDREMAGEEGVPLCDHMR